MNYKILYLSVILLPVFISCSDEVESLWKGPDRNWIYSETGLLQEWPDGGPSLLWRYDSLFMGHSSPAITKEAIYVTGMPDSTSGYLFCLDREGKLLWKDKYGKEYVTNYTGSRSTPVIAGNYLYLLSGLGELICYNLNIQAKIWTIASQERFGSAIVEYGHTQTLLIDDDRLYLTPGGEEHNVVCLDRYSGDLIWSSRGNGEKATYSSPILADHNGKEILVTVTQESIMGLEPIKGELLWSISFKPVAVNHINTPVYSNGKIFMAAETYDGEGGFIAIQLSEDGSSATVLWERKDIRNALSGFIIRNN